MVEIAPQRGYIALMVTMIIGLVLLVMVAQQSVSGWRLRFGVLGVESKAQSYVLADSCGQQAVVKLIADPTYVGNEDISYPVGTCHVFPLKIDSPAKGQVTIQTQAVVNHAYTTLEVIDDLHDIHLGAMRAAGGGAPNIVITPISQRELVAIP